MTLRKEEIEAVARYIDRQEEHHRGGGLSRVLEQIATHEVEGP